MSPGPPPKPNYWEQMINAFTGGFFGLDEDEPETDASDGLPNDWFGRQQSSVVWDEDVNPITTDPVYEEIDSRRWMKDYKNGKIPINALTEIPGGDYMRPDAAAAFIDLYEAALSKGIKIKVTSAYRTYDQQRRLAAEKGLYSQGGLAAVPGTSQHGWGMAIDIYGEGAIRFMQQHGKEYGFETIPREPWHWQYNGSYTAPSVQKTHDGKRARQGRAGPGSESVRANMRLANPNANMDAVFGLFGDQALMRHVRKEPSYMKKDDSPQGSVKRQLWQGFMDAGRKDLARMVYTKDFDAWIRAESGWRPSVVSPTYQVNGVWGVNGGLFQIRYPAHPWAHQYFSDGNNPSGTFTASPYEQALMVAEHFPGLTAAMIREYGRQVRSGGYHGWP